MRKSGKDHEVTEIRSSMIKPDNAKRQLVIVEVREGPERIKTHLSTKLTQDNRSAAESLNITGSTKRDRLEALWVSQSGGW